MLKLIIKLYWKNKNEVVKFIIKFAIRIYYICKFKILY